MKKKKLMLYDNTKKSKGSVRELTFKDLKQQVFNFVSDFNLKKSSIILSLLIFLTKTNFFIKT